MITSFIIHKSNTHNACLVYLAATPILSGERKIPNGGRSVYDIYVEEALRLFVEHPSVQLEVTTRFACSVIGLQFASLLVAQS